MKIDFVRGSDWEGLFINGKLVDEAHTINLFEALKLIAEEWEDGDRFNVSEYEVDYDWLEDRGDFPTMLKDIPRRKIDKFREIGI